MEIFFKATACVFLSLILCIILNRQGKDFSLLLSVTVCVIVAGIAIRFLTPLIELLQRIQSIGKINSEMLTIMLKVTGIGIVAEISLLLCNDVGNSALGKTLQFLASALILWLSIPLFTTLIELMESVLISV